MDPDFETDGYIEEEEIIIRSFGPVKERRYGPVFDRFGEIIGWEDEHPPAEEKQKQNKKEVSKKEDLSK